MQPLDLALHTLFRSDCSIEWRLDPPDHGELELSVMETLDFIISRGNNLNKNLAEYETAGRYLEELAVRLDKFSEPVRLKFQVTLAATMKIFPILPNSEIRIEGSMTTLPHRLSKISGTLRSIREMGRGGSLRICKMNLVLPRVAVRLGTTYDECEIAQLRVEFGDWLRVVRCEHDIGPGTKILPVLIERLQEREVERDGGELSPLGIISFDDDHSYHSNLLHEFYQTSLIYSHRATIGQRWFTYHFDPVPDFPEINLFRMVEGFMGIFYPLSAFAHGDAEKLREWCRDDLLSNKFPEEYRYSDDLYLADWKARLGIATQVCEKPLFLNQIFGLHYGFEEHALHRRPNGGNNDSYVRLMKWMPHSLQSMKIEKVDDAVSTVLQNSKFHLIRSKIYSPGRNFLKMLALQQDHIFDQEFSGGRVWELETVKMMKELLRIRAIGANSERAGANGKAVCADVGAHVGSFSLAWASWENLVEKVFAFEPFLPNRELLQRNVSMNGFDEVIEIIPKALGGPATLGQTIKMQKMIADGMNFGTEFAVGDGKAYNFGGIQIERSSIRDSLLSESQIERSSPENEQNSPQSSSPSDNEIQVPISTLDCELSFAERKKRVDLIKMDVEGCESWVLDGGRELIEQSKPIIIFEMNEKCVSEEMAMWMSGGGNSTTPRKPIHHPLFQTHYHEPFFLFGSGHNYLAFPKVENYDVLKSFNRSKWAFETEEYAWHVDIDGEISIYSVTNEITTKIAIAVLINSENLIGFWLVNGIYRNVSAEKTFTGKLSAESVEWSNGTQWKRL